MYLRFLLSPIILITDSNIIIVFLYALCLIFRICHNNGNHNISICQEKYENSLCCVRAMFLCLVYGDAAIVRCWGMLSGAQQSTASRTQTNSRQNNAWRKCALPNFHCISLLGCWESYTYIIIYIVSALSSPLSTALSRSHPLLYSTLLQSLNLCIFEFVP